MPKFRTTTHVIPAVFALGILTGCGATGPQLDGAWVSENMNDAFECQMGRVMVISGDRIDFGVAGRVVRSFEGLQTEAGENGMVVMRSDDATFEFSPGDTPETMTLLSGPMVVEHHTSRLPTDLARCG